MYIKQIYTTHSDADKNKLVTTIRSKKLKKLGPTDILCKMVFVPIHGSFWLAADPRGIHPRKDEFMENGGFVFGNGGVASVVAVGENVAAVSVNDIVAIFGHMPCSDPLCNACSVLNRYSECDFGLGGIIGHGKNAPDGTFSDYVILPEKTYELVYKHHENPTIDQLKGAMYAFLLADVRNALTRNSDVLKSRNMMLFGAGNSGMLAAYLFLNSSPNSRLLAVDSSSESLSRLKNAFPSHRVSTELIPENIIAVLEKEREGISGRVDLKKYMEKLSGVVKATFDGERVNLLFDASSGNSAQLWDNSVFLSSGTVVIPFGFASDYILITKDLIQCSGLTIMMSRGVGNIRNRKETVKLIRGDTAGFILEMMVKQSKEISGIDAALEYINSKFSSVLDKNSRVPSGISYISF